MLETAIMPTVLKAKEHIISNFWKIFYDYFFLISRRLKVFEEILMRLVRL